MKYDRTEVLQNGLTKQNVIKENRSIETRTVYRKRNFPRRHHVHSCSVLPTVHLAPPVFVKIHCGTPLESRCFRAWLASFR